VALSASPALSAAGPPNSLRDLVFGAGHRPVHELRIDSAQYRYLAPFSKLPFLLWPATEGVDAPFARDHEAVRMWLDRHRDTLGTGPFHPVFLRSASWRDNEVWSYRLVREGVALHGARIDVHWRHGGFEGLMSDLPGPIDVSTQSAPEARDGVGSVVWFPRPKGAGGRDGVDLELARVQREVVGPNSRTRYVSATGERLLTVVSAASGAPPAPPRVAQWTEYNVPSGTFPDQIDSDSQGKIWFSQPLNDMIRIFDPVAQTFDQVSTGNDDPDGLIVDSNDLVWSGLYYSGRGLGRVDVATHAYTSFAPPYGGSLMAIPFETCAGGIWVTDHQLNRVSEFDPLSQTWVGTHLMPTADCWVVDTAEDPATQTLYFTEYNVNQLGVRPPGGPISDVSVSSGGPSFHDFANGVVYYTLWTRGVLGAYDVSSGANTEYLHPHTYEFGGPMDLMANGDVVVGSRNAGYVYVLRLATETWESYKIPTSYAGLKDGLHVDAQDVIWITESGADKIAKLELGPLDVEPVLAVSGSCPGIVTAEITNAAPRARVAVVYSPATGAGSIPCGSVCGGSELGLGAGARLVATVTANELGAASVSGNAPAGACSGHLQVIDLATCLASNVEKLPM